MRRILFSRNGRDVGVFVFSLSFGTMPPICTPFSPHENQILLDVPRMTSSWGEKGVQMGGIVPNESEKTKTILLLTKEKDIEPVPRK
jgi:hypothetical protein